MAVRIFTYLVTILLLSACGNKGALYLPQEKSPASEVTTTEH